MSLVAVCRLKMYITVLYIQFMAGYRKDCKITYAGRVCLSSLFICSNHDIKKQTV